MAFAAEQPSSEPIQIFISDLVSLFMIRRTGNHYLPSLVFYLGQGNAIRAPDETVTNRSKLEKTKEKNEEKTRERKRLHFRKRKPDQYDLLT